MTHALYLVALHTNWLYNLITSMKRGSRICGPRLHPKWFLPSRAVSQPDELIAGSLLWLARMPMHASSQAQRSEQGSIYDSHHAVP